MNIYCKKYLNLLKKDLILSKDILLVNMYVSLSVMFFPLFLKTRLDTTIDILAFVVMLEMMLLGNYQILISEKCKGNELILTTSYTRKNVVYSRHFFFNVILSLIVVLQFLEIIFYYDFKLNLLFILSCMFITYICNSAFLFMTFLLKNSFSYIMSSSFFLAIGISVIKLINTNVNFIFTVFLFLLAVLSIISSVFLSNKFYSKKSL